MPSRKPGKRALLFILVTVLLDSMGFGVILPVMPELIMELTGEGLSRAVSGIAGASFTPAHAYIADVSPPEKRAQSFGMMGAAFGAGFILGPALGGMLGELGPRAPFFAAAGLSLLNFTYGYFVLPETLDPAKRRSFDLRRANPVGTLIQIRKHPVVLGLLAVVFLWQVAHQVMPSTWSGARLPLSG